MLARHDWVTPMLDGQPWLEKPVLYYWQAMISFSLFGVSDWAARIPSATDATLAVLAVYLFLRRFRPGFHLDAALITASTAGMIGYAHAAATDMPLAAMFTIAMLGWFAWYESRSRLYLLGFYCFLGLAALAKGPVAVFLAGAVIVIFLWFKGNRSHLWSTLWAPGIAIFAIVALPWYVAVQLRNPEFFRTFIVEHNLARFATDLYQHQQPVWYFVPVLLLGLVPWTVLVVAGIIETARIWRAEGREIFSSDDAFSAFCLIWLLVPLVFFSFSQSKLPGYILPAIPGGAMLLGEYLRRHSRDNIKPHGATVVLHSIVAGMLIPPAFAVAYLLTQRAFPPGSIVYLLFAAGALVAGGIAWTLLSPRGLRMLRFVTLIPVVLGVAALLRIGAPVLDETQSARPVAQQLAAMELNPLPVAVYQVKRQTEYGLAFYRNQIISSYDRHEVPAGEHLLVAKAGTEAGIARLTAGRRISHLGSFPAQRLEFYWVAAAGGMHYPM
jgi:4-amino-4-deoxy-L-arabinose transferase-like glycosyltransferase